MKTAKFQYKCRLCGEVYSNSGTAESNGLPFLVSAVRGYKFELEVGGQLKLIDIHSGCKLGVGVADLIGYTITE